MTWTASVRAKVTKADQFLAAAECMRTFDAYDATVSLAVSAAINASDAIILDRTDQMPSGNDHEQAVTMLRKATDRDTSTQLQFVLGLKNKAQYAVQGCTATEADAAIKRAVRLVNKSKGV